MALPVPILSDETVIMPSDDCVAARVDDETVLMHVDSGAIVSLDQAGEKVWHWLSAKPTLGALIDDLQRVYDVSAAQCRADVVAYLGDLHRVGFVAFHDVQA